MHLYLNDSRGRARVKNLLGQANHLIITALVGLDAIERRIVTEVPDELRIPWSPKDPVASARRSRRLILDMTLVHAVDAIAIYISTSRQVPQLTQLPNLQNAIDNAKLSVMGKFNAIEEFHRQVLDPRLTALVAVMIAWRNRSVHADADVTVNDHHRGVISTNVEWYAEHFSGLSAEKLLADFDKNHSPVFKEIAAFIRATQEFVLDLEKAQFSVLDKERYLRDVVRNSSASSAATSEQRLRERRKTIQGFWGRDVSDRPAAVYRFLRQAGLSDVKTREYAVDLTAVLYKISTKTPSNITAWLTEND